MTPRPRAIAALAAAAVLAPGLALAHERFVKHQLKVPLKDEFFLRHPGAFLGVDPSMLRVGCNAFAVLAAFLLLWFIRQPLDEAIARVARRAGGPVQRAVHQIACFLTDRPVRNRVFHAAGEWMVIAFLRVPGLVLMYSAANNALVLPSYPLDPRTEFFFKMAQTVLAVLILTQTLLPLCGALLVGTWIYLNRWGWIVAMDALPVLSVAAVYLTSPWESHKLAITEMNEQQVRLVRLTLGVSFVVLGWLKVYNHDLIAGVADNYPSIQSDPMVSLFALGTDPRYHRECWVVSFAMAEVMSGFLLMTGTFTRLWATIMATILTKLMIVDFGWNEIPHICFIAAMGAVAFSNRLKGELDPLEALEERAGREGHGGKQMAIIGGTSLGLAFLVVFPTLIALTFSTRANLRL